MVNKTQFNPNNAKSESTRLILAGNTMYRDSSRNKDQRFLNCFQESIKNEITEGKKSYVVKRPGLTTNTTITSGTGRGIAYFNSSIFTVIGDKLYRGTSAIQTLGTSTGPVGFKEFDNEGLRYLFVCDGTDAYVVDTSWVVTKVNQTYSAWVGSTNYALGDKVVPTVANGFYYEVTTDGGSSGGSQPTWPTTIGNTVVDGGITWTCAGNYGGFPSPHVPTPEFIDGYMLLPATNSQDVYNSDVDNVFGWGTGNFVTAEIFPDNVVALARQNNQIIAFGSTSGEFLYDAAATGGSPFARNDSAVLQMGIAAPYAIYQNEKFCLFVGQSDSGGRAVWLVEGFQPKKVSTEFIERILDAEGTSLATARGFGLRTKGHLFFIIRLTNTSIVYDLEEKVWHEWTTNSNGSHTAFAAIGAADSGAGYSYLLHPTNGVVYNLSTSAYDDSGTSILMEIYTAKFDLDTMNRKFMHNLNIVGDLQTGSTISLRWSDDDYQTWSNWKTLDMASRAFFTRLGSFRRRAFNIKYTDNYPCRLEFLECEVDVGTH